MDSITSKILCALQKIDNEQIEGGIYALPDRYAQGKKPASHHHIFGGDYAELNLCSRIGVKGKRHENKKIHFEIEGEAASLQFVDMALTKVRSYGDRFLLDKHHGKKREDCSQELSKAVSKLCKEAKKGDLEAAFLVALIFTDSERHSEALITPFIADEFLSRYGLSASHQSWADPHGRGIWTSAVCWQALAERSS